MKPTLLEKFLASIATQPFAQPFAVVAGSMRDMGIGDGETADILRPLATAITAAADKSALRAKAARAQEPAQEPPTARAKGPARRRGE